MANGNVTSNGDWFKLYLQELRNQVENATQSANQLREQHTELKDLLTKLTIRICVLEDLARNIKKFQWAVITAVVLSAIGVIFQVLRLHLGGSLGPIP